MPLHFKWENRADVAKIELPMVTPGLEPARREHIFWPFPHNGIKHHMPFHLSPLNLLCHDRWSACDSSSGVRDQYWARQSGRNVSGSTLHAARTPENGILTSFLYSSDLPDLICRLGVQFLLSVKVFQGVTRLPISSVLRRRPFRLRNVGTEISKWYGVGLLPIWVIQRVSDRVVIILRIHRSIFGSHAWRTSLARNMLR